MFKNAFVVLALLGLASQADAQRRVSYRSGDVDAVQSAFVGDRRGSVRPESRVRGRGTFQTSRRGDHEIGFGRGRHGHDNGNYRNGRGYHDPRGRRTYGRSIRRTHSHRVWVPGYYRQVWSPPQYGWCFDPCGRRYWGVIRAGCYQNVWVPGRYEYRRC